MSAKSMPKSFRQFQVDPILKIDETFYKQAESMCGAIFNFELFKNKPILFISISNSSEGGLPILIK